MDSRAGSGKAKAATKAEIPTAWAVAVRLRSQVLSTLRRPRVLLQRLTLILLLAAACSFYLWTATSSRIPATWGTFNYYSLLTDAFLNKSLSLLVEPTRELLSLPDPYDPRQNRGLRLHDVSLYKGKYYLYWGPTPALAVFIPFRLIFGSDVPANVAAALFCSAGLVWSVLLWGRLRKVYFPDAPFWMHVAAVVCLGLCNTAPFIIRDPGVYDVPIASGYCFLFAGIYFLVSAALGGGKGWRWRCLLGSLCLGLAVGSRPHLGLASLLLFMVFVKGLRDDGRRKSWALDSACLFGPCAACLVLLAWYNYARFESVLQFGQRYQLQAYTSSRDWTFFDPSRLVPSLYFFLVAPARLTAAFPFLHLTSAYPGSIPRNYYVEPTAGILTNIPFVNVIAAAPWLLWSRYAKVPKEAAWFLAFLIGFSLVIMLFPSVTFCATMRYELDFVPALLIAAVWIWFALDDQLKGRAALRRAFRVAGAFLIIHGCLFNLAIGMTGYNDQFKVLNPETYGRIERVFAPLERFFDRDKGDEMKAGFDLLYERRDPAGAIPHFRSVLDRNPDHYGAQYQLAAALDGAGRLDEALAAWHRFLASAEAIGDGPNADHARERIAELDPSPENYLNLSLAYYKEKLFKKSISAAKRALKLRPDFAEAYNNIGSAYMAMNMWDQAIAPLEQALRLNPGSQLARNNLNWAKAQKASARNHN